MRIAIVTDTFSPDLNGVAMSLERFARGLLRRGHGVELVSPVKQAGESLLSEPGFWRYRTDRIPLPGYPGLRLGVPSLRRIDKLWKDNRPDIVYIATEAAMGVTALRVARKQEIPTASGFHTNFHSYSKDYRLPFLEEVATSYLRRFHNESDATFAPAEDVVEKLHELGFENVRLLGRGVDTEQFQPGRRSSELRAEWGAGEGDPVALYVGRIAAEKNLDLFFRACDRIREREPGLRVVLVGDGPTRRELERSHPEALFAGAKRGEDLATYYASADLFLFPSTSETYGNVVVEALASGLVVVAYDYAAPAKFLREGENGFLAVFDDREAFLGAADRAADSAFNWDLRAAAGAAAADQSWDKVVEGFERDLLEIVESYEPRGAFTLDFEFKSPWVKESHDE